LDNTGSSSAAKIAMMEMTTSSSIKVNACRGFMFNKTPLLAIRFKVFSDL